MSTQQLPDRACLVTVVYVENLVMVFADEATASLLVVHTQVLVVIYAVLVTQPVVPSLYGVTFAGQEGVCVGSFVAVF